MWDFLCYLRMVEKHSLFSQTEQLWQLFLCTAVCVWELFADIQLSKECSSHQLELLGNCDTSMQPHMGSVFLSFGSCFDLIVVASCVCSVSSVWVFLPSSSWFMLVVSVAHKSVCTFPSCLHHSSDCLRLCLFLSVFPVLWLPAPPALFSSMFKAAPGLRRYFETSTNQR